MRGTLNISQDMKNLVPQNYDYQNLLNDIDNERKIKKLPELSDLG